MSKCMSIEQALKLIPLFDGEAQTQIMLFRIHASVQYKISIHN